MTRQTSRRRFLKATAAVGALAGVNAAVLAQGQDQNEEVILLGGQTPGWLGYRLPGEAEATQSTNPTMTLQEGTTYTLMWQNVDGASHNFALQDSDGNNLQVLQPLSVEEGVFQEVNETEANQSVSLEVSDGNVTGVTTGNETDGNATDGNETDGNATGDQTTVPEDQLVEKTEIISEGVQAAQFTASSEMVQYICLVHPNSMVGDVNVESGEGMGNETNNSS